MGSNQILWITTVVMLAGGLLILFTGKRRTPAEELQTVLHGVVPIIAACSYLAMATGQGLVVLPTDAAVAAGAAAPTRIFYFARYVDWTFTTPLLLLSLGLTAMRKGPKWYGALTGAVLADLMMIVTGIRVCRIRTGMDEVDLVHRVLRGVPGRLLLHLEIPDGRERRPA